MRKTYGKYCFLFLVTFLSLFVSNHPLIGQVKGSFNYAKLVQKTEKQLWRSMNKPSAMQKFPRKEEETPLGWWIQDYIATMDPALGRPTPEVLLPEMQRLNSTNVSNRAQPGAAKTQWERRGPNNLAGRSRCVEFDPTDATGKKVWAGAVTGGLWYNNDISSATSKWYPVSDLWANITVTAIAFDPNNPGTMYIGTGEGWGTTSSSSRGYGILKSTDSGRSFQHLTSTASYYYINDLIVRNENGSSVVYAAVDVLWYAGSWQGSATSPGIYRSTNGGTSFTNLNLRPSGQSFNYAPADFEIDAYNRLWVSTRQNSATGATDKGGGRIFYSDNGTSYTEAYKYSSLTSRVELGVSPKHLAVYAMIERSGKADTLIKSLDRGLTWQKMTKPVDADLGIAKTDFSRTQAWYDWIMAVSPVDSNILVCGAIDMFYSKNGGSTWGQASKWSNNPGLNKLSCSYVHADIHALKFHADGKRLLIGCDGGVFYAPDINNNPTTNSSCIVERNNELLITQFYWGDISQTKSSNFMIAGAQDNGSHVFLSSGLNDKNMLNGGDGGYCFISSLNDNKQVVSYVYNQFFGTTNNWTSFTKLIDDATSGKFINPAILEPINDHLYSGKGAGTIYRNKLGNASSAVSTLSFGTTALGNASAFCVSKTTSGKAMLYVGTDAGKVLVSNDAAITTPVFSNITGTVNAGNISSILRHNATDTLFITLSNYGISNVYFSPDAGTTWIARDGNLPNMPVWSILINPNKYGEALIATELGIYGTSNIYATNVVWTAYNLGMGPVKTMTLRYRNNDRIIMAVTHGRGIFTSDAWNKETPVAKFGTEKQAVCATETITLLDSSSNSPISWKWTITPNSGVVFKNGTNAASKNPKIQFTQGGKYEITLEATNTLGSDILTKPDYIEVTDSIILAAKLLNSKQIHCLTDTFSLRLQLLDTAIKSTNLNLTWKKNASDLSNENGLLLQGLKPQKMDIYSVVIKSTQYCVSPNSIVLQDTILQTTGVQNISVFRFMDTMKAPDLGSGEYIWYRNGSEVGRGRNYIAKSNGNYRCIYVENGCFSDSSNELQFKSLDNAQFLVGNTPYIYPSVTSRFIRIAQKEKVVKLLLINELGQCILTLSTDRIVETIDLQNYSLPAGAYWSTLYGLNDEVLGKVKLIYTGAQ